MTDPPKSLGTEVAKHRALLGWTQQELADRIGVSRTALSHIEAGMSDAGERTVTLLAGVFRVEPAALVEGTNYPRAKVERLPLVSARYTEVEHLLDVLAAETTLLERHRLEPTSEWCSEWAAKLRSQLERTHELRERERLRSALSDLS